MDKQQEQMNQNPNQEVEYISTFLDEDEEVNESEFDEPIGEQEAGNLAENQQNKPEEEKEPKKPKRPRKTIEQEIAELDAKRERLMEKKRRQEAHEKIVFGATVMAMLKYMKEKNDSKGMDICKNILDFIVEDRLKNKDIIDKIIFNIFPHIKQ